MLLPWVPEAFSRSYYMPLMFHTFAPQEEFLGKSEIPLIAPSQLKTSLIRKHPESGCFTDWLLTIF